MTGRDILLHEAAKLQTVHHRHHHIAYYQLGNIFLCHSQSLLTVLCFHHIILPGEYRPQIRPHARIVIDYQYKRTIAVIILATGHDRQVLLRNDIFHGIVVDELRISLYQRLFVQLFIIARLRVGDSKGEDATLARLTFHTDCATVQVYIRLDDSQSDASSSHRIGCLIETLKDMLCVIARHSLSIISHRDGIYTVGMLQADDDSTLGWSILYGIGHEIEEYVCNLLPVCNHDTWLFRRHNADTDLLSFSHSLEVVSPRLQIRSKVKAVKHECCFIILNLAEFQNLTYHLRQNTNIATYHPNKFPSFAANALILRQTIGWSGDERKRGTQFMRDVGKEAQLHLRHLFHFLGHLLLFPHTVFKPGIVFRLCQICLHGKRTSNDKQRHHENQHKEIAALRIECVGCCLNPFPQRQQIVALSFQFLILHEQHVGIVACHECR